MNKPTIIFRANGGTRIGLGHLVRCAALSSILKNNFHTILLVRSDVPKSIDDIRQDFDQVEPIDSLSQEQEVNHILSFPDALLVLDGYNFDFTYQQKLASKASQLVCIDDIHQYPFMASAIINHGGGILAEDYDAAPWCQFYLGASYAMLRKPFRENIGKKLSDNRNLFICLGGSDPNDDTHKILTEALAQKAYDQIDVVVGNGYQHFQKLNSYASSTVTLHQGVSAEKMAALMQACTFAICSPSSVAYEYLSVGAILFLVLTAENQRDIYNYLLSSGLAYDWKHRSEFRLHDIEETIRRTKAIFDGQQEKRLSNIFLSLKTQQRVVVRRATANDLKLCHVWANDPHVRQNSFTQEPISWETHIAWFQARLSDEHSYFYILEHDGVPMAQIRFQVHEQKATLNYLLDKQYRNKGLASMVVSSGIKKFVEDFDKPVSIFAHVKFSNIASQRAFEKMKFKKQPAADLQETYTYSMVHHANSSWR